MPHRYSIEWLQVLSEIIQSTPLPEKQRLATATGITVSTLDDWATDILPPQSQIIKFIKVLQPEPRDKLVEAMKESYSNLPAWLRDEKIEEIPPGFFAEILKARTETDNSLRFWRICDLVLSQALVQLDPNQLGLSIRVIQCVPPMVPDSPIRSLRERVGKGTPPWTIDLEHDIHFLGSESLSGHATEVQGTRNEDNLMKLKAPPAVQGQYEMSSAAHPIRFEGRIAGCLLASSTQEAFFSPERLAQITAFSDLIALAFERSEFYPPEQIKLSTMPPLELQRDVISHIRERVMHKLHLTMLHDQPISIDVAEQQVWWEIEQELIELGGKSAD
jgi:hypothetical protein